MGNTPNIRFKGFTDDWEQRKCDETKELKKFMLQKMFPKNGEKKRLHCAP